MTEEIPPEAALEATPQADLIDPLEEVQRSNRFSRFAVQPLLISLMVSALAGAFLSILNSASSRLPWLWISLPVLIFAIEGVYTTIWITRPDQRLLNKSLYRAAEVLLIVVSLRIYTWWLTSSWPDLTDLENYLRTPSDIFADPFFFGSAAILFMAWGWGLVLSEAFQHLALNTAEMRYYNMPVKDRPAIERPSTPFRSLAFEQYGRHFLMGAVLITAFAALSTIAIDELTSNNWRSIRRLPFPPGMLAGLLAYFGAGFALLSQARLAVMNSRWLYGGSDKTIVVEQSWVRQTGWLLGLVGTVAAFLPLGSTTLIGRLLEGIVRLFFIIAAFIASLFAALFALLFPASRDNEGLPLEEFEAPEVLPPDIPVDTLPSEPGFPIIGTLFWIIAIVVTILAIGFFLNDRGIKIPMPSWRTIWGALTRWWNSLWRIVVNQAVDLRDALVTRLVRDEVETDQNQPWRFIRLNSLNSRQKLRYFYLSTVQRAERGELARDDSETPLEYADELKEHLPQVAREIDAVTAGFLQARYDDKDVTTADVEQIEPLWKSLRAAIKNQGKQKNEPPLEST